MRTVLFLIALAITDLAPVDVRSSLDEIKSVVLVLFIIFAIMDITEFIKKT